MNPFAVNFDSDLELARDADEGFTLLCSISSRARFVLSKTVNTDNQIFF